MQEYDELKKNILIIRKKNTNFLFQKIHHLEKVGFKPSKNFGKVCT